MQDRLRDFDDVEKDIDANCTRNNIALYRLWLKLKERNIDKYVVLSVSES